MYNKIHKGQAVVWIILIIAIVALIALWVSKNPAKPTTTTQDTPTVQPTTENNLNPTPTKSLLEIDKALKELNSSAADIDKGIDDAQLDITQ